MIRGERAPDLATRGLRYLSGAEFLFFVAAWAGGHLAWVPACVLTVVMLVVHLSTYDEGF